MIAVRLYTPMEKKARVREDDDPGCKHEQDLGYARARLNPEAVEWKADRSRRWLETGSGKTRRPGF